MAITPGSHTHTVFYSWQSDSPNRTNRGFIQDCLERALKQIRADDSVELFPCLDRDTQNTSGSPDIAQTIFSKIQTADVFVADVSFINSTESPRRLSNPNVLIELGYAAASLGWDHIICVFNAAYGRVEQLPFDLRPRTIRKYSLTCAEDKAKARQQLVSILRTGVQDIIDAPNKALASSHQEFREILIHYLIEIIIFGEQIEVRMVDYQDIQRRFMDVGNAVRNLATEKTAEVIGIEQSLMSFATDADSVAHLQVNNSLDEIVARTEVTVLQAKELKTTLLKGHRTSAMTSGDLTDSLRQSVKKLEQLLAITETPDIVVRLEEVQAEAASVGYALLKSVHVCSGHITTDDSHRLLAIGSRLHLLRTVRLQCDGGASIVAIADKIRSASQDLSRLRETLVPQSTVN